MYEERGKTLPDGRIEVIVSDPSTGQEVVRYYSPGAEPKVSLANLVLKGGFLRDELMPPSVAKKDDLTPLATKEELRTATNVLARSEVMDGDKIKRSLLPAPSVTAADGSSLLGSDGKIRHDLLPEAAGGSVDLQPLENRVTALEGKDSILGEDGKVKADLLPDSCKNEHCPAQTLPSDVVRTADIEDVVRKSALFDTEHNMILPELIPEAEVAVKWLKGKGRPDKPETTEGVIVGNEAECTRYLSTDGAGTGAWEWEKRGGVWHVVRGDTGWREFENPEKYIGKIKLRRTNDRVSIEFGGGKWDYFGTVKLSQSAKIPNKGDDINGYRIELHQLSEGFRSCTNAINQIFDDETNAQVGMVLVGGVKDNTGMVDLRFAMTVNREKDFRSLRIGIVTFPTVDRWPETLGGVASASCPI